MIHSNSEGDIYIEEMPLLLVHLREEEKGADARLSEVLSYALDGYVYETATEISTFEDYVNRWRRLERHRIENPLQGRILFAVPLGTSGINLELYRLIRFLREHPDFLNGFVGGLLVDSENDLYSKSAAKDLVFAANCAGCAFVGRPLVEGTRTLSNYTIVSNNLGTDLMGAYRETRQGWSKVLGMDCVRKKRPKYWCCTRQATKPQHLCDLEPGERTAPGDGDPGDRASKRYAFRLCRMSLQDVSAFWRAGKLFLRWSDGRGRLSGGPRGGCHRDALSKLQRCAVGKSDCIINRLTSLFRTTRFYDKALFAVVVSGYSGSDIVAEQLIAALNMNKTFYLPGHFAMMETANNAGAAMQLPGIEERMNAFAERIRETLLYR